MHNNTTLHIDYTIESDLLLAISALKIVGIWELITCLFGAPFNLFALYLTVHLIRHYQANNNRWFILSMCLADLLFTAVHSPINFLRYFLYYRLDGVWCKILFLCTHTSTVASSLSLLWLNCDKFVYMNKPLHYHLIVTKRRIIFVSLFSWFVSIGWASLFVFGPFNRWNDNCAVSPVKKYFWLYIIFAVTFFVLPTLISLVISVYVASVAMHARHKDTYERKVNRRSNDPNWVRSASTSRWKTITFVFTTTIWSAFTSLPYRCAYILMTLNLLPASRGVYAAIYFGLLGLLATNAMGNPIITILTQSLYRMKVWQIFGLGRPRNRGGYNGDKTNNDYSSSYSSISVMQVLKL